MSVIVHDEPVTVENTPLEGYAKFLTVGKGVTLVRFAGKDTIHLAARRKGTDGSPNTLFTIDISKSVKIAEVRKDGVMMFVIEGAGVNYSTLEALAVSALHRWFKETHRRSSTVRKRRKREAAAMEAEFHTPPQSIVECGGECHDPECGSGAVFCNLPMIKEVK